MASSEEPAETRARRGLCSSHALLRACRVYHSTHLYNHIKHNRSQYNCNQFTLQACTPPALRPDAASASGLALLHHPSFPSCRKQGRACRHTHSETARHKHTSERVHLPAFSAQPVPSLLPSTPSGPSWNNKKKNAFLGKPWRASEEIPRRVLLNTVTYW